MCSREELEGTYLLDLEDEGESGPSSFAMRISEDKLRLFYALVGHFLDAVAAVHELAELVFVIVMLVLKFSQLIDDASELELNLVDFQLLLLPSTHAPFLFFRTAVPVLSLLPLIPQHRYFISLS